ncbi:hypothetical protein RB213_006463, partial [Colletotrichum asianum]
QPSQIYCPDLGSPSFILTPQNRLQYLPIRQAQTLPTPAVIKIDRGRRRAHGPPGFKHTDVFPSVRVG